MGLGVPGAEHQAVATASGGVRARLASGIWPGSSPSGDSPDFPDPLASPARHCALAASRRSCSSRHRFRPVHPLTFLSYLSTAQAPRWTSGFPAGSLSFSSLSNVIAPRQASISCLRSAFDGIFPRVASYLCVCRIPRHRSIRDAPEPVSALVCLVPDDSCRGLDCASRSAASCDPTLCVPASIHGRPALFFRPLQLPALKRGVGDSPVLRLLFSGRQPAFQFLVVLDGPRRVGSVLPLLLRKLFPTFGHQSGLLAHTVQP